MENTEQKKGKSTAALREERVLAFWKENNIFEKSVSKNEDKKEFVFYEGPPTANAKPALHHLEARAFKDVIPRYKTMQGFHVRRRAGWDTHGLPVELQIEKKLGLQSKKEIEQYGVAQFNKECKDSVFEYIGEWEKFTDRIGYWVDKKNAYYTFDANYVESLWSIVKHVNDRDLLYKDYKVVPWCPRCGTGLSSHELAQGYQDVKDLSVYAKFKIIGFDKAYFLAWTTTPWTLPGNVALAVGKDIEYVEIKVGEEIIVLAKDRLSVVAESYEIIATHKGSEMVGMQYEPLYPYLGSLVSDTEKSKLQNAYKVYSADFVTTTDGTGIVHIAPMYGADDFVVGTENALPKFHLVDETGNFIVGTEFLEGKFVKSEDVAVDIIKDLAHRGLLFKKEKYEHSYPHCWRCKTPLIYYARDSWYIGMSKLRKDLIKENEKINWEPAHIKEGRFGEWIREAKDWAISRERYWGTPLPIWVAEDGEKIIVDSYETLKKYTKKSGNTYFVMRHGETEGNLEGIIADDPNENGVLTEKGVSELKASARSLKGKIDLILYSPLSRTKESANIIAQELGLSLESVISDIRLTEMHLGPTYDGKKWEDYHNIFPKTKEFFDKAPLGGESYREVRCRVMEFLFEVEEKYANKKILIVTHGGPAWLLETGARHLSVTETLETIKNIQDFHYFKNAEVKEVAFVSFPHNENYELDPHRPYIDDVVLEKDGKAFRRVKEVMDVWFDSGAMPFAQDHYPFEKENGFNPKHGLFSSSHGYPADFISEAIDQTRGWFYTLLAVGVLMEVGTPYKNVICLGHLLDKEGKKMSKSIGNIVNPWEQMDKFGVDTLRLWMYSVNQPGDSKNYDEKTVAEIHNKIFNLFYNVLSFYELYRDTALETSNEKLETTNVLDQWILARLNELVLETTNSMDAFKVLEPVRALRDFIDDLSTWYLRRSRDRIKDGDIEAKKTLYTVMKIVAQIMAPFAPFAAEDIWQKLKNDTDQESVHLSEWPKTISKNASVIDLMDTTRQVCTVANALRKNEKIAIRQPLSTLSFIVEVKRPQLTDEFIELIKDEINIKEVKQITEEIKNNTLVKLSSGGVVVFLNTEITLELKQEGNVRELIRALQDMRKEAGLTPKDSISLLVDTNETGKALIEKFETDIKKTVLVSVISFTENDGNEITVEDLKFKITIEKQNGKD